MFSKIHKNYLHLYCSMETIVKKIQLYVPVNETLPDNLYTFTPEETILMLRTGYQTIVSAKNGVQVLTHDELYQNIQNEIHCKYEEQINTMQSKLSTLEVELKLKDENLEKQISKRLSIQNENFEYIQGSQLKERELMQSQLIQLEKELFKYKELQKDNDKEHTNKINEEAMRIIHH